MKKIKFGFSRKRIQIIIMVCLVQLFSLGESNAQAITIHQTDKSVREILRVIEKTSDMVFFYNNSDIDLNRKVTLQVSDESIEKILDLLFADTQTTYKIDGRQVYIMKKSAQETMNVRQQKKIITGTITDKNGESIIGANIVEKGTTNGTVTDVDGNFSLSVDENSILSISYIGYVAHDISTAGKTHFAIVLHEDTQALEELIIIGYGRQSKRFVTGAIANVDLESNAMTANTNISQALRGKVAGVQFIDAGRPGEGGSILVRGTRSISASNNPLIIVDGITFNGSLSDINPDDVHEMRVLKDASSASIYGSRAANGVILIETKKGKSDKPVINFSLSGGFQDWSYTPKLLSPEQYLQKTLDYRYQNGQDAYPEDIVHYLSSPEVANYERGHTINPYDEVSQSAYLQNYSVSISGSTSRTSYYLSGLYTKENGLIYNDNAERISVRINLETKIYDWLKVGINTQFARRDKSGVRADLSQVHFLSPYSQLYLDDDTSKPKLYPVDDSLIGNPLFSALTRKNEVKYNNLFSNIFTEIDIPFIKGLSYRLNYSPGFRWDHTYVMNPIYKDQGRNDIGSGSKTHNEYTDWVLENIVDYTRDFGLHNISATFMYGSSSFSNNSTTAGSTNYFNDVLGWDALEIGETQTSSSGANKKNDLSMMGRINYRYNNRYLLTLTVRQDGSSVFGKDNKYATFPSSALAWIISEEPFFKDKAQWIDMLKLRLSWGKIGNQAINAYGTLAQSGTTKYVFGDGGATSIGIYPSAMGNNQLKWETTTSTNIAMDFQVLKNRLSGTLEYYDTKTNDLLLKQNLPIMTGFSQVWTNLGETNNKGFEVTLNSLNIKGSKFSWSTDVVFSYNKNKIVSLYGIDADGDGREDDDISNAWFIGQPVHVEYDYVFDGIYQVGDPMPAGYQPGYVRVKTASDDPTQVATASDREVIGQKEPKYRWGLTNTFTYDNWSLSVFVNSMTGWISKFDRILPYKPGAPVNMLDVGYWTEENKSNTRPSLVYTNPLNHRFYLKRDFVRIQDITLSYNFKKEQMSRMGLQGLRVYATIKNLYTYTDWLGLDPETGNVPGENGYPTPRTFMLGVNFSF